MVTLASATIKLDKGGGKAIEVQGADTTPPIDCEELYEFVVKTQEKSLGASGCPAYIRINGTWYKI
jgi:hypothetical protein